MPSEIFEAVKRGEAKPVEKRHTKRGKVKEIILDYVRTMEMRNEAPTEDDIIKHVQKKIPESKVPGIRAVLTKLVREKRLVVIDYKGQTFYMLRSTFERLRREESTEKEQET